MAERLVREHGADIRYIAPWKKWVVWDDARWQVDTGALLYTRQLEMVRNIYAELLKTADYRDRIEIEKYAIQSESMRRREASVRAAQYIPCLNAAVDDLDKNPWLLNVENGTIDLKTVTFNGNSNTSGTVSAVITQTTEGAALTPPPPGGLEKTRCAFGGWNTKDSEPVGGKPVYLFPVKLLQGLFFGLYAISGSSFTIDR